MTWTQIVGSVCLAALTSFTAVAREYQVRYELKTTEARSEYDQIGDNTFELTYSRSVQDIRVIGTGVLRAINNTQIGKVTENGPNTDSRIKHSISLEQRGRRTVLRDKLDTDLRVNGRRLNISWDYSAEVSFVRGSYEDFQRGRPVKLRYTERGRKEMMRARANVARKSFAEVRRLVRSQLARSGASMSQVTIDAFTAPRDIEIDIRNGVLKMKQSGSSTVRLSFDVDINL